MGPEKKVFLVSQCSCLNWFLTSASLFVEVTVRQALPGGHARAVQIVRNFLWRSSILKMPLSIETAVITASASEKLLKSRQWLWDLEETIKETCGKRKPTSGKLKANRKLVNLSETVHLHKTFFKNQTR